MKEKSKIKNPIGNIKFDVIKKSKLYNDEIARAQVVSSKIKSPKTK